MLMWTEHRINTEKLYFLTRETNNMDTEEEDISAIYINLINMINAFTNLQMNLIFSIRSYYKKKMFYEIFCYTRQMKNTKLLKGNRLLESIGWGQEKIDTGGKTSHRGKLWKRNGEKISGCQGKRFKFFEQNYIPIFLRMIPGFETQSQLISKLRRLCTVCKMKAIWGKLPMH